MLKSIKVETVLIALPIILAVITAYFGYSYYSTVQTYSSEQEKLFSLQRRNRELRRELETKKFKVKQLKEKREKVKESLKSYKPFSSPEDVGREVTKICVKNNLKLLLLNSEVKKKEISTQFHGLGKEEKVLASLEELLNSFPLKVEKVELFSDKDTHLIVNWDSPVIKGNEK